MRKKNNQRKEWFAVFFFLCYFTCQQIWARILRNQNNTALAISSYQQNLGHAGYPVLKAGDVTNFLTERRGAPGMQCLRDVSNASEGWQPDTWSWDQFATVR